MSFAATLPGRAQITLNPLFSMLGFLTRERNNMSRNFTRLTQNSLRDAISDTVRPLQGKRTDHEMAEDWGVSAGTVLNARNQYHTIGLDAFLRLGKEFGAQGVDKILFLVGLKAQRTEADYLDITKVPQSVAECLPLLIEKLADGEWSDADQAAFERAGVVNILCDLADVMKEKRAARHVRRVA